jgi:hypothetical protein
MINNLSTEKKYSKFSTHICIVGGGTVGLYLADILRSNINLNITVLEAGSEQTKKNINKYFKVKTTTHYNNVGNISRLFGIGGSSIAWAGAMIPLSKENFKKGESNTNKDVKIWNIPFREMYKFYLIIEKKFKFKIINTKSKITSNFIKKKIKYFQFCSNFFNLRFSSIIPIKIKNFNNIFFNKIKNESNLNLYTNATVFKIKNLKSDNVKKINVVKNIFAFSENGNILEIEAELVVICCGAIESTRLLCIYDKENGNFIKEQKSPLGNYFSDQVATICGKFIIKDWKKFYKYFSPVYWNNVIQVPRLVLKKKIIKNKNLSEISCQFILKKSKKHWIQMMKYIFDKKKISLYELNFILLSIPQIIIEIFNYLKLRLIRKNNWFYKTKEVVFHVNLEQQPNFNNRLFITNEGQNKYTKIERSVLIWKIRRKEIKTLRFFLNIFNESWKKSGLNKIAELKIKKQNDRSLLKSLKVFLHPTGSIRIGSNKSNSVVNKNLRVWGSKNLYVCSTAVFPSSGSSNTGMTLLALTARLGDHLMKKY